MKERELFDKQYNDYLNSLGNTIPQVEDKIAQLNSSMRELTPETKDELQKNREFVELHQTLQECVQTELVELVKKNINSNPEMVSNINKQLHIINELNDRIKDQDRKNMAQINDYLKNFSDMTFDEYKKMKNI